LRAFASIKLTLSCRATPFDAYSATSEAQQAPVGTPRDYMNQEEASWRPAAVKDSPRYSPLSSNRTPTKA